MTDHPSPPAEPSPEKYPVTPEDAKAFEAALHILKSDCHHHLSRAAHCADCIADVLIVYGREVAASARASAEADAAEWKAARAELKQDNDRLRAEVAEITQQREEMAGRAVRAERYQAQDASKWHTDLEAVRAESSLLALKAAEALEKYGRHTDVCIAKMWSENAIAKSKAVCVCGLEEARRALPSAPPACPACGKAGHGADWKTRECLPSAPARLLCRLCLLPKDWGRMHEVGAWPDSHEFRSDADLNPSAPATKETLKACRGFEKFHFTDQTDCFYCGRTRAEHVPAPATPETHMERLKEALAREGENEEPKS